MPLTKREYVDLLKQLGHFRSAAVRKGNGRYYVECECGMKSTQRQTLALAIDAIEHHRRKVLIEYRANGRVLPLSVGPGR